MLQDKTEHSHVPWIFILLKAIEEWQADPAHTQLPSGGGREGPSTFKQKREFKARIAAKNRGMEENFQEACSQAHYAFTHPGIPEEVDKILKDPRTSNMSARVNAQFWVAMRALRDFVDQNGTLPLEGGIPDMTADTASYIALQQVYQRKASKDVQAVIELVRNLVKQNGCEPVPDEYVASVCKNAAHLRVKHFASLEKEYGTDWALPLLSLLDGSQSFDGSPDKNVIWCVIYAGLTTR